MPSAPSSHPPSPPPAVDSAAEFDAQESEPDPVDLADARAARNGDRTAFARLHERYAPMVHGIALSRVPLADAADLTQEVFVHAIDRLHLLRDLRAFGPWLATIARNLAVAYHRRGRLRLHKDLPAEVVEQRARVAHDDHERASEILKVVRSLPETYAETLVLRLVEGLTGPQIAACTGMTHGSVRVNLNRGMALLRARMQEMNMSMEDAP
jgi:RNA polymerase sigma-70 factor (ECF subfamily)